MSWTDTFIAWKSLVDERIYRLEVERDALRQALRDVIAAAEGGTNGRNVTEQTRRVECGVIARATLRESKGE